MERARGAIEAAPILPAQEEVLRRDAKVGSIHYSNIIEGNDLPRLEALRAVEHELVPDDRAKLELVNYVAALDFIDRAHREGAIEYTAGFLKNLHGAMTRGLGREDSRFKPKHEGEWRDGHVAVGDSVFLYHVAPPPEDVPGLMEARLDWLERRRTNTDFPAVILVGVAHFEVAEVHPFADYNGRTARLFATAVMFREKVITRPLFSPERYYAEDKDAYYAALRAIKMTHHLDEWLTYFVGGLAEEFERVAQRVRELNALTHALRLPLQLTTAQERAVAALTVDGQRDLTLAAYAELGAVSTRTASRELNALVDAGVLRARGATRDRRFVLATQTVAAGGRPRKWSEDRIAAELRAFVDALGRWPSYSDFQDASKLPLYAAIARNGGMTSWEARVRESPTATAGIFPFTSSA